MITFIYSTCRTDPKFEWFITSLVKQVKEQGFHMSGIQIVLVDAHANANKGKYKCPFEDFVHVAPKPSPWQGPYKVCKDDFFCAAIPRNTGLCYTKHPYVCFIDDTSVMGPGSFQHIVRYARNRIVVGFSYKKVHDLEVNEVGDILHKREVPSGIDSRLGKGEPFRKIFGSQLYGYSASPLALLLQMNGYDEITNSIGGEDYQYGMRVEKLKIPIYYSERVIFYESEDHASYGTVCSFIRRDPEMSDTVYADLMTQYNVTRNYCTPPFRKDSSHFLLDLLTLPNIARAIGNTYDIAKLRKEYLTTKTIRFDTSFDANTCKTIDGVLLKDL